MGQLNIRDVPDEVIRKCKMRAFENRVTLRQYVIMQLAGNTVSKEQMEEVDARPEAYKSDTPVPTRVPDVVADPRPAKKGKTCRHGTTKGDRCWQCGGLAQI